MNETETIYNLIDMVRRRPGMYIGSNRISDLSTYLAGAQAAMFQYRVGSLGAPSFAHFDCWTHCYFKRPMTSGGWRHVLLDDSGGDEAAALDAFFRVLDVFRASTNVSVLTGTFGQRELTPQASPHDAFRLNVATITSYPEVEMFLLSTSLSGQYERREVFSTIEQAMAGGRDLGVVDWMR